MEIDIGLMYAKHGNLVDPDGSGAKASTKHFESRLEVIQLNSQLKFINTTR